MPDRYDSFAIPLDLAYSSLAANFTTGISTSIQLRPGTGVLFSTPTVQNPIRVLISKAATAFTSQESKANATLLLCTQVYGDTLLGLSVVPGWQNLSFETGDQVSSPLTAEDILQIEAMLWGLYNFVFTSTGLQGPPGATGIQGIPGTLGQYNQTFTQADLVNGILTVTHNLDSSPVLAQIYNNIGLQIDADIITIVSSNVVTVNLQSLAPITGTWSVTVAGGAMVGIAGATGPSGIPGVTGIQGLPGAQGQTGVQGVSSGQTLSHYRRAT